MVDARLLAGMKPFASVLPALLLATIPAQDMIGVTFAGQVLRVDSTTGAASVIATGQPGKNSLACTTDNRLITTIRTGTAGTGFHSHLVQIDPFTGAETLMFGTADVGDLRGMAAPSPGVLLAIRDASPSDQLIRIDLVSGAVLVLGSTGFTGIQALDVTGSGLRAWDITAGVLLINSLTGAATDPFPGVGGPAGLQWMATNPETNLTYVGSTAMHRLNVLTGVTVGPLAFSGSPDLRGVAFTNSRVQLIGTACAAAQGLAFVGTNGPFGNGLDLGTSSVNHAPGALGVHILGFSETQHAGQPLPLDLDALLGTSGCFLRVSIDATVIGFADQSGRFTVNTPLPPGLAFVQFFVQHAAFEAVPGGMSWSAGLRVRPAL